MQSIIRLGGSIAEISSVGATLERWSIDGEDIIYPFRHLGEKQRGGIPIRCPFFGSTPKGFEGIPQHGWLRHKDTAQDSMGNVALSYGAYLYEDGDVYPWSMEYEVGHKLVNNYQLIVAVNIALSAYASGKAPINVAFHPYFISHGNKGVYINGKFYNVGISPEARCIEINPDDNIIINTGKFWIKMILSGFNYDTQLYLWSDSGAYFCVEPVLTHPLAFNTEQGVFLRNGDSLACEMRLSVLEGGHKNEQSFSLPA